MGSRLRYTVCITYLSILAVATHLPPQRIPDLQTRGVDKLAHLGAFGVLGLLAAWARDPRTPRQYLQLGALAAVYAAADELTQPWIGRHAEWFDWFADVGGAAAGLCAYRLWRAPGRER